MALTQAIQRAHRDSRLRQIRAELRMDEQLRIEHAGDLIAGYVDTDKKADERFIRAARHLHKLLDTDEQRNALYILIAEWERDERDEERIVGQQGEHNDTMLALHKKATPMFVDGAWTPGGEDGAA